MTKAQIRAMCAESGVEPPEPTPGEKYARRKKQLEDFLAAHPNALWAKNELKFMTVDDFSEHKRPLVQDMAGRGVCDAAVQCERQYHGGYID